MKFKGFLMAAALLAVTSTAEASVWLASQYGRGDGLNGRRTASGAVLNARAFTAAHKSLPFGTRLQVCYRGCVVVTITDRGPFTRGRDLDLTAGAASAIGHSGVAPVRVTLLH